MKPILQVVFCERVSFFGGEMISTLTYTNIFFSSRGGKQIKKNTTEVQMYLVENWHKFCWKAISGWFKPPRFFIQLQPPKFDRNRC